jgi:hypothetical protein
MSKIERPKLLYGWTLFIKQSCFLKDLIEKLFIYRSKCATSLVRVSFVYIPNVKIACDVINAWPSIVRRVSVQVKAHLLHASTPFLKRWRRRRGWGRGLLYPPSSSWGQHRGPVRFRFVQASQQGLLRVVLLQLAGDRVKLGIDSSKIRFRKKFLKKLKVKFLPCCPFFTLQ